MDEEEISYKLTNFPVYNICVIYRKNDIHCRFLFGSQRTQYILKILKSHITKKLTQRVFSTQQSVSEVYLN